MADDIVHRLQVEIDFDGDDPLPLLVDAKAEIERLRAAGDALAQSHERTLAVFGFCREEREKSLRAWEEARRG